MNFADYISELKAVILNLHGTDAEHVETVPVTEEFQGQTVWEGEVEVFELSHHPKRNVHTHGAMQQATKAKGDVMSLFWNCRLLHRQRQPLKHQS